MNPSTPWSRHRRHHHVTAPGAEPGEHLHHPHAHPGRGRFDSPRADGGSHRHHPPFGGPGGPFGGGPFGGPHGEGPQGPRGGRRGGGRHGRAGRGDVRS